MVLSWSPERRSTSSIRSQSTESVIVAPVVISDVVTGPGGAGSGVSAALMSLNASPIAPMATPAQAPTPADATFNCLEITSDHSKSVSV